MSQTSLIHYLPILTTLIAASFSIVIFRRYLSRRTENHLLWWSAGVCVYGLGTLAESWITLFGWNPVIFKF